MSDDKPQTNHGIESTDGKANKQITNGQNDEIPLNIPIDDNGNSLINTPDFNNITNKWRVKLYTLEENGNWQDRGTGSVCIVLRNSTQRCYLFFCKENDCSMRFNGEINELIEFNLQRKTIITWKYDEFSDSDNSALSFQDINGIKEIWFKICEIKHIENCEDYFQENNAEQIVEDSEGSNAFNCINVDNGGFIAQEIQQNSEQKNGEDIGNYGRDTEYSCIKHFGQVGIDEEKKIEELNSLCSKTTSETNPEASKATAPDSEVFSLLYSIYHNIIVGCDREVLSYGLNNDNYINTFGILERCGMSKSKNKYREFLKTQAKFINLLNIENTDLFEKVHFNYRLTFLKDTVMGSYIDETTLRTFNSIIQLNYNDILQFFLLNDEYLSRLINFFLPEQEETSLVLACKFGIELINCVKEVPQGRFTFIETINNLDTLDKITKLLNVLKNSRIKSYLLDILNEIVGVNPMHFKDYISNRDNTLVNILFESIASEKEDLQATLIEIIKTIDENVPTEGLSGFGKKNIDKTGSKLIEYLSIPGPEAGEERGNVIKGKKNVINIINSFVSGFGNQMSHWIQRKEITSIILNVVNDQSTHTDGSIVKYIQSVGTFTDPIFIFTFLNEAVLSTIFVGYNKSKRKKNLLFSCITNIFLDLLKNNKKTLFGITSSHKEFFYDPENKVIFKDIITFIETKDISYFNNNNKESLIKNESDSNVFEEGNEVIVEDEIIDESWGRKKRHNDKEGALSKKGRELNHREEDEGSAEGSSGENENDLFINDEDIE